MFKISYTDTEDSEAFADTIPINRNKVNSEKKIEQQSLTTNTEDSEDDIRRRNVRKRNGRRVVNPFIADDDVTTTTNSECKYITFEWTDDQLND